MNTQLAPHEAIEIRALISQEMLGIKKINASMSLVQDSELKSFMQDSLNAKKASLQNIQSALS
ncbi:hypothetical protein D2A34_03795 [Clostridium chromiireducens]|uniref:Spore coat protein n=1 Tax=Clostridium chromiireducens TaxID=225345 RepID=A0A399IW99_9CLOT|nr:hypothetical protein [Clostridium chromiireducens]RII36519.1 hypothetical protein D2A34_03795 [Clostridium chromiireducens]